MSFNSFIANDIANSEFCLMFDKEHFRRIGKVFTNGFNDIKITDKQCAIPINIDKIKPIKVVSHNDVPYAYNPYKVS